MEVACGQCLGCRLNRSLSWAMRITHESTLHESAFGNCFVTLTYDDEHLPHPPTLHKTHFQKFVKRLRKHFPQKIRYFHCGEYGDETRRPHYHACLFNVSFPDQALWKNDDGIYTFTSPTLEKLWPYGFSTIGELNFETAAYVSRYCLKKVTGNQADAHYEYICPYTGEITQLEPEYVTMSLKPGIGKDFFDKYSSDFFDDTNPVPGKGLIHKLPRYYQTIMESEFPEQLEEIKQLRETFRKKHLDDYTPERLYSSYKITKKRLATTTKRGL